eukprot:2681350-Rhodomonas_salina.2
MGGLGVCDWSGGVSLLLRAASTHASLESRTPSTRTRHGQADAGGLAARGGDCCAAAAHGGGGGGHGPHATQGQVEVRGCRGLCVRSELNGACCSSETGFNCKCNWIARAGPT